MDERKTINLDVAILGGGFAGVACAQKLARTRRELKTGLIATENHMVFQPMLPEVVGASVSPRHVVNPLRLLCPHASVYQGDILSVDLKARRLVVDAGPFAGKTRFSFRDLVIALGAAVDLSRIPGMPEHAFLMQNVGDAMLLRSTLISRIEEANLETRPEIRRRLLSFAVVGGGYSGVETAGQILDLLKAIRRYYPGIGKDELRVSLIHSREYLLPTLSRPLGQYAGDRLRERGLDLRLNQRVRAVTASYVLLDDGNRIETHTVISTVGNAPHALVSQVAEDFGLETLQGRIRTDGYGRVAGREEVWAAGDCAAFPLADGGECPANAQFAIRQGALVAGNISRSRKERPLKTFTFRGLGELATIGHHVAVADLMGLRFSGFLAWWMWRTIYLSKLPRLDRKVRVVIDWTLDLFFPRDINLLNPRYTSLIKEIHLEVDDHLYHTGEPAFSLYIVKEGRIQIYDREGTVKEVEPGEYFGERALLQDGIWRFNARAAEPTRLVSVPAHVFHQIVGDSGSLASLFRRSAAQYKSREVINRVAQRLPETVLNRTAGEVMIGEIICLIPSMTLAKALEITRHHAHSSYPLVDRNGVLLGAIRRDDLYDLIKNESTGSATTLAEVARSTLPTITARTGMREVVEKLIRSGANKLIVVDGSNRPKGIITLMDLVSEAEGLTPAPPEA